jgi:hypothetical protein
MELDNKLVNSLKSKTTLSSTPKAALLEKRRSAVFMLLRDEIYPSGILLYPFQSKNLHEI